MYKKINVLRRDREVLPQTEFLIRLNKWDRKVVELMAAAEKRCRKIKTDHIDLLPIVGYYKKNTYDYTSGLLTTRMARRQTSGT